MRLLRKSEGSATTQPLQPATAAVVAASRWIKPRAHEDDPDDDAEAAPGATAAAGADEHGCRGGGGGGGGGPGRPGARKTAMSAPASCYSLATAAAAGSRASGQVVAALVSSTGNTCIAVRKVATPLRELACHIGSSQLAAWRSG